MLCARPRPLRSKARPVPVVEVERRGLLANRGVCDTLEPLACAAATGES